MSDPIAEDWPEAKFAETTAGPKAFFEAPNGRIESLTGVRGVAAVWVMLYHLQIEGFGLHLWRASSLPILGVGWSGVDLFFVLSGFILMTTHGAEFAAPNAGAVARFALVRFSRIYPLNWIVLLLIALGVLLWPAWAADVRATAPGNLSLTAFVKTACLATRWFLPGTSGDWNQPVWSLSVELLGYVAFPLLAWALQSRRSFGFCIGVAAVSLITLGVYLLAAHSAARNRHDQFGAFARMIFCFVAGTALARARRLGSIKAGRWASPLTLAASGAILVGCLVPKAPLVLPGAYAALVFALSYRTGPINWALSTWPARFLGRISFPLYLVHVMLLKAAVFWTVRLTHSRITDVLVLAGVAFVAIALATLLHYLVERPAHRWGRRIASAWFSEPRASEQVQPLSP